MSRRHEAGSGVDSQTGTWVPEFPGQRPPFPPGHELSLVHGANSPRRFGPLAAELELQARTDPGWPEHLNATMYRGSIAALFRAEARIELLVGYLNQFDAMGAMTETIEVEENETQIGDGKSRRVSITKRISSALERLHREESLAMNLRSKLGLDPLSFSKIQADVAKAQLDLTKIWAEEHEGDGG